MKDAKEKSALELETKRALRDLSFLKPIDVVVLDSESLEENMKPGTVLSGPACGYRILYDEVGLPALTEDSIKKLASEDVVLVKRGKRLNVSAYARAKLVSQSK